MFDHPISSGVQFFIYLYIQHLFYSQPLPKTSLVEVLQNFPHYISHCSRGKHNIDISYTMGETPVVHAHVATYC